MENFYIDGKETFHYLIQGKNRQNGELESECSVYQNSYIGKCRLRVLWCMAPKANVGVDTPIMAVRSDLGGALYNNDATEIANILCVMPNIGLVKSLIALSDDLNELENVFNEDTPFYFQNKDPTDWIECEFKSVFRLFLTDSDSEQPLPNHRVSNPFCIMLEIVKLN
jgi:hypothetical protein